MLHELTIGESRDSIFQKDSCTAILNAIAQTPEDFSVLDWTKFYPEFGVYQITIRMIELELEIQGVWNRGNYKFEKIE
jgi:hypothetical protein